MSFPRQEQSAQG